MRRLIVNADDFGLTSGVNRAVAEAFDAGVVTSTTLMAGQPTTEEALPIAAGRPTLGVGLHFNLTHGRPLSAASPVPRYCSCTAKSRVNPFFLNLFSPVFPDT